MRLFKQEQVFRDRLARHGEVTRKLVQCLAVFREQNIEKTSAAFVGEGLEDRFHAENIIGNQMVACQERKKMNVAQILERKSRFLGKGGPRKDKWGIAARYAAVGARQDQAQPPVRGKQEWLRYRLGGDGDDFGFTRDF